MAERILKEIRFYESEKQNTEGDSIPKKLGKLFYPTKETHYIGQRIARKLNELKFTCGEFDHIYINFTTLLKENKITISGRKTDNRIKYIDYGINPESINLLSEITKNDFIKSASFQVLRLLCKESNLEPVIQTEQLIAEFDTEIKFHYKTKENSSYKIDIHYKIQTANGGTMAVIEYRNKNQNILSSINYNLQFYEDIYTLVDTIALSKDEITLKPKKSFTAEINNERYKTPIILKLTDFKKFELALNNPI